MVLCDENINLQLDFKNRSDEQSSIFEKFRINALNIDKVSNKYKDFIAAQQSEDKRIKIDLVPADEERRASRIVIFD